MALLEVKNLTMKFGSLLANSDVSFNVEKVLLPGLSARTELARQPSFLTVLRGFTNRQAGKFSSTELM